MGGYDQEQCPERGPGLVHKIEQGLTCAHCGKEKTEGFTLADWFRAFRVNGPRVVKVSGEPEEPEPTEDRLHGDFSVLTEYQWHRLEVERWYREHHPDPDDAA